MHPSAAGSPSARCCPAYRLHLDLLPARRTRPLMRTRVQRAPKRTLFSAGTELVEDEGVHPWPQAGIEVRPRPVGTRADGADQTRDWPIMIEFTVSKASPKISERARHVLAQACALKSQLWRQDGSTVAFRAEVRASGYKELEAIVDPLLAAVEAELGVHLTDMTVNLAAGGP